MNLNGWVKWFKDGQTESGFDEQIKARTASWQHGRLDGLIGVTLRDQELCVWVNAGEGNWWQSDTFVSKFQGYDKTGMTSYIIRRVQKQIDITDIGKYIVFNKYNPWNNTVILDYKEQFATQVKPWNIVKSEHINKWLTVEIDVIAKNILIRFCDQKQ